MRVVPALVVPVLAAVLALAGCADVPAAHSGPTGDHPTLLPTTTPDAQEAVLVTALHAEGVPTRGVDVGLEARVVCAILDTGGVTSEEAANATPFAGYAAVFGPLAVQHYCPEYGPGR